MTEWPIRDKTAFDQAWIEQLLKERWGSTKLALRGRLYDAANLPALIAGNRDGLATYRTEDESELMSLDAVTLQRGVGSALVAALAQRLQASGFKKLWVTTTNDNLDAMRFYQRRGFRLMRIRPEAVNACRLLKPISQIGAYGIAIRDEIDLCLDLTTWHDDEA